MKAVKWISVIMIISLVQIAWSGTTQIVLQNAVEGGYQGCGNAWIDRDWGAPTGDDTMIKIWYELCET